MSTPIKNCRKILEALGAKKPIEYCIETLGADKPIKDCVEGLEALGVDRLLADATVASMDLFNFSREDLSKKLAECGYKKEEPSKVPKSRISKLMAKLAGRSYVAESDSWTLSESRFNSVMSELQERKIIKKNPQPAIGGEYVFNSSGLLGYHRVFYIKSSHLTPLGQQVVEEYGDLIKIQT